jgi:hypothetical protein
MNNSKCHILLQNINYILYRIFEQPKLFGKEIPNNSYKKSEFKIYTFTLRT